MKLSNVFFKIILGSLVALLVYPVNARTLTLPQPIATSTPNKIEVIEFFSYACPHCSSLNPTIKSWAAKLPAKVSFRRVPVSFGRNAWTNLGKLFYSLETLGQLDKLDDLIFTAIHKEGALLSSTATAVKWAGERGVDSEKLQATINSFAINSKMNMADKLTIDYQVESVPSIAVNGRYIVFADGGFPKMLSEVDELINKEMAKEGSTKETKTKK